MKIAVVMKRNNSSRTKLLKFAPVLGVWVALSACGANKHVQFTTAIAEEGTVEQTVMATGYIQPVEKVEVGTQVSGVIEKLYVDFNSYVTKGQLLAELDKATLNERLTQARASLASSNSNLTYAQQNYDRVKQLHDAKAATDVALEEAVNRLDVAKTNVANEQANVQQAQVNLSYANIYSPIDGVVLDRSVATGQTVAASFNTPTLFTIAEDLTKMQVEADVDEADIGQVRVGQSVTFTVDAFNNDIFHGTVSQVRLQPTVTNNVVTYTVIVEAPNPDEKLFPGMTANITIVTEQDSGILIPVSALNFKVTEDIASRVIVDEDQLAAQGSGQNNRQAWVISEGGVLKLRQVETGLGDGVNSIAKSGIAAGEEVITAATFGKKKTNNGQASNPLMPRPPGRR